MDAVVWLLAAYFSTLALLCVYGMHRLFLVWLFHRVKERDRRMREAGEEPLPVPAPPKTWPRVTVQLPLYNERTVAARLIDAVAALAYPREMLEIQVLDDSTDETVEHVAEAVAHWRAEGLQIEHIRRPERVGYKAGALDYGLRTATGELVAIFDADFLPRPDFLQRTVPYFDKPETGLVQARWSHLNRNYSWLTRTQATLLDAHFIVEHQMRHRTGRFFNFNGTAGIWRRECIDDAGGWQHETLTEDLDLSYRAQINGWRFVFLPRVDAPAELPVEMNAFKSQQYRWTKGSTQCALKLLRRIWRAPQVPLKAKLEATIHLTANVTYLLLALLAILLGPAVYVRSQTSGFFELLLIDLPIFFFGTLAVCDFFLTGQRWLGRPVRSRLVELPLCLAVGMGLCLNNARAVISALAGRDSPFVRTPKYAITTDDGEAAPAKAAAAVVKKPVKRYSPGRSVMPYVETLFGLYFVAAIVVAVTPGVAAYPSLPFLMLFACGFLTCGLKSLGEMWRTGEATATTAQAATAMAKATKTSKAATTAADAAQA